MAKDRLIAVSLASTGMFAAAAGSALAEGVYTDSTGYAYAPYIAAPVSQFGSLAFSFKNAGGSGNGAGVFWNYGGSVVLWLNNLGSLTGDGVPWVRPTLQLQSPGGDQQYITASPPIELDGRPHIVSVAYGMQSYQGYAAYFMHWMIDGIYFYNGDPRNSVIRVPAYAFAPAHSNGWGWFSAWPAEGGAMYGGVSYHPGDFNAFGGSANPSGSAVWLRGSVDYWYNQFGLDIEWTPDGLVTIEDIVTWP